MGAAICEMVSIPMPRIKFPVDPRLTTITTLRYSMSSWIPCFMENYRWTFHQGLCVFPPSKQLPSHQFVSSLYWHSLVPWFFGAFTQLTCRSIAWRSTCDQFLHINVLVTKSDNEIYHQHSTLLAQQFSLNIPWYYMIGFQLVLCRVQEGFSFCP